MKKFLIPLGLFLGLVVFLALGLQKDPREIPSPLVGRPAPAFRLQTLGDKPFGPEDLRGRVWLLNVWATWCVACREEHAVLVELARQHVLPIVGLNYKEVSGDGPATGRADIGSQLGSARQRSTAWLQRHGNPYDVTVFDLDGRIGIDYGVYGVPETYLIDGHGVIRYKRIGGLTPELLEQTLLPMIRQLESS